MASSTNEKPIAPCTRDFSRALTQVPGNWWEFWLVHRADNSCCDWSRVITLVLIHQIKNVFNSTAFWLIWLTAFWIFLTLPYLFHLTVSTVLKTVCFKIWPLFAPPLSFIYQIGIHNLVVKFFFQEETRFIGALQFVLSYWGQINEPHTNTYHLQCFVWGEQ